MVVACRVCGAEAFDEELGLYFCTECHTQCEVQRELILDEAFVAGHTRNIGKTQLGTQLRGKKQQVVPAENIFGVDQVLNGLVRLYTAWVNEHYTATNDSDRLNACVEALLDRINSGNREPNLIYDDWRRAVCTHAQYFLSDDYVRQHDLLSREYHRKRLRLIKRYNAAHEHVSPIETSPEGSAGADHALLSAENSPANASIADDFDQENDNTSLNPSFATPPKLKRPNKSFSTPRKRGRHKSYGNGLPKIDRILTLDKVLQGFDKAFKQWPFFLLHTPEFDTSVDPSGVNRSALVLPHAFPHYLSSLLLYVAALHAYEPELPHFCLSDVLRWERLEYLPPLSTVLPAPQYVFASNHDLLSRAGGSVRDRLSAVETCNILSYALGFTFTGLKSDDGLSAGVQRMLDRLNLPRAFTEVVKLNMKTFGHIGENNFFPTLSRQPFLYTNARVNCTQYYESDFEMLIACHVLLCLVRCYGFFDNVDICVDEFVRRHFKAKSPIILGTQRQLSNYDDDSRTVFSVCNWLRYLRVCRALHAANSPAIGAFYPAPVSKFVQQQTSREVTTYWNRKDKHSITRASLWQHTVQLELLCGSLASFNEKSLKNLDVDAAIEPVVMQMSNDSGNSKVETPYLLKKSPYEFSMKILSGMDSVICLPAELEWENYAECQVVNILSLSGDDEIVGCSVQQLASAANKLRNSHKLMFDSMLTQLCESKADWLYESDTSTTQWISMPALRLIIMCVADTLECGFKEMAKAFFKLYEETYRISVSENTE